MFLRTLYLTGAQASGTYIDMAGSTLYNSLDTLYVGLPGSVGCSVGVGYLVTEGHALAANFTLCHYNTPPSIATGHTARLSFLNTYVLHYSRLL